MPTSHPPILIIGGGLIGPTLSHALTLHSIPHLIFERDPNPGHRGAGWGLTIHWALQIFYSLVPESVKSRLHESYVDPEAERTGEKGHFLFYDARSGEALWKVPPSERVRLRREGLRKVLLDGIDIKWSMALSTISVPESGTNEITAHFADGTSFGGSLLIGCDGARSHVRELLCPTSFQTHQLPVRLLGVSVVFPTAVAKPLRDLDPYFMQAGDKKEDLFLWFSFLDGPSNNDRPEKESYTCQILISWPLRPPQLPEVPASAADRVALMKRLSSEWSDPFKSIIAAIPDDAQPVTLKLEDWPPPLQPGVQNGGWDNLGGRATLVGDAAHAMTMYRGEAFNHALRDLQVLVENIAPVYKTSVEEAGGTGEWSKILKDAVDRYEKEMCARGRPAVLASRRACLDAHEQGRIGPNSPLVARRVMRIEELEGME